MTNSPLTARRSDLESKINDFNVNGDTACRNLTGCIHHTGGIELPIYLPTISVHYIRVTELVDGLQHCHLANKTLYTHLVQQIESGIMVQFRKPIQTEWSQGVFY